MKALIKPVLLLAIVALCFFEFVLRRQSSVFLEFEAVLLQTQWMLLVCLAVWFGAFLFMTFNLKDLPLIGLLIIAIVAFFISQAEDRLATDAVTLLFGATLGKGTKALLNAECGKQKAETRNFLVGLTVLLAFSSWWHLDMTNNYYHGSRWMGLWNNPNDYGMLMSVGLVVAVGLLAGRLKADGRRLKLLPAILYIAAGMTGTGLMFSYSRGAWLGTAIGLLYLAKAYGKFKWRFVLPGVFIVAAVVWFFWSATADTAPWFVKRMDLGRPSAQHRVAAWKAGFEIMRDHPFGVGWNKAIETYEKNYSPPEGGALAITTNDYLTLGTQLGLPGLLCFIAYVASCLRSPKPKVQSPKLEGGTPLDVGRWTLDATKVACRAGALAMLVAFWFDGGLFKLATAAVFWVLLELGRSEMGDF